MNDPVSLIVVTHGDRLACLQRTIPAMLATRHPFNLTVVCNEPAPPALRYLTGIEQLTIIVNRDNLGYAVAANQAWQLSAGDVCFVGDDCLSHDPDWLRKLVDIAEHCPEVGIVGHSVEASWPTRRVGERIVQVQPSGLGGVFLVPRRTWELCGYFNEGMGLYGEEDALYGWKVRRLGLLCAYFDHSDLGRSFEYLSGGDDDPEYRAWKDARRAEAIPLRNQLMREYEAGRPLNE